MGEWNFLSKFFENLQAHSPMLGRFWLLLMLVFRILILGTVASNLFEDEQREFACNTLQPGCKQVCYDMAFPISQYRFWVFHIVAISTPSLLFMMYAVHHSNKKKGGSRQSQLSSRDYREEVYLKRLYIVNVGFRLVAEVGILVGQWWLYGFRVEAQFPCSHFPCPYTVDCFTSRPTEKTIFLRFYFIIGLVSAISSFAELCYASKKWFCPKWGQPPPQRSCIYPNIHNINQQEANQEKPCGLTPLERMSSGGRLKGVSTRSSVTRKVSSVGRKSAKYPSNGMLMKTKKWEGGDSFQVSDQGAAAPVAVAPREKPSQAKNPVTYILDSDSGTRDVLPPATSQKHQKLVDLQIQFTLRVAIFWVCPYTTSHPRGHHRSGAVTMGEWNFLGEFFENLQVHSPMLGRFWLLLMLVFRILILGTVASDLFEDEQHEFACNTLQPGCKQVCYDMAFPISQYRFWVFHIVAISTPSLLFMMYAMHHFKKKKDGSRQGQLNIREYREEVYLRQLYIVNVAFRLVAEVGVLVGQWWLYGFGVEAQFPCSRFPCPYTVDCFTSRPTEKTIFLRFYFIVGLVSALSSFAELCYASKKWFCVSSNSHNIKQEEANQGRPGGMTPLESVSSGGRLKGLSMRSSVTRKVSSVGHKSAKYPSSRMLMV
ncbi:uncharacterized protein LOC130127881 [Lampris incognitus]|uniref:uncharacterized protein LOC130127881 n=1 Tax=Lampris incognitus TaxID=2546036 RepID=UPI0024B55A49|nr:uncharacterized protein LOC130127881 [Lampris incognitus]